MHTVDYTPNQGKEGKVFFILIRFKFCAIFM
jgi:hypothetical protein